MDKILSDIDALKAEVAALQAPVEVPAGPTVADVVAAVKAALAPFDVQEVAA